ncbi:MAG: hypothetical protein IJX26_03455 [Clostridia bacterium]|nr:hypothetical protein [Clostridia bacterium]
MKKFLIFLVSIVVVICLGMTFYYFAKDEEIIKIKTDTIYLNAGESISLDELGFSHTRKKPETKINFNAGGDNVTSIIKYDSVSKKYITTATGGTTTIVITTNNKKFKRFEITVHVGNGSETTPFQISTVEDLIAIGTSKFDTTPDNKVNDSLYANYELTNDIDCANLQDFSPIGIMEDGSIETFQGNFNGRHYSISNLEIASKDYGGLFAIIGENAIVENLNLNSTYVTGNFSNAGVLAGIINGYVDRIGILDSKVANINKSEDSYTGMLAGKIATTPEYISKFLASANAQRINIDEGNLSGYGYVGGVAGIIDSAQLVGAKVNIKIVQNSASSKSYCGGITGKLVAQYEYGFIGESYSLSTIVLKNKVGSNGALIGYIDIGNGSTVYSEKIILGLYYNSENCSLDSYAMSSSFLNTSTVMGKTETQLKNNKTDLYYYNASGESVYWDASVWKVLDGRYPELKYTTQLINTDINNYQDSNNNDNSTNLPNTDNNDGNTSNNPNTDNQDNNTSNPSVTPSNPDNSGDVVTPPDIKEEISTDVTDISSAEDLLACKFEAGKTYYITQDINLNGKTWNPKSLINATFTSKGNNNFTISNFVVEASGDSNCGFFTTVNNSTIKNINFKDVYLVLLNNAKNVGVVAGSIFNKSKISNINIKNSVIGHSAKNGLVDFAGGIAGFTDNSSITITNVSVEESIIKGDIAYTGGLMGYIGRNTSVTYSTFSGTIAGHNSIGGVAGINNGSIYKVNTIVKFESSNSKQVHNYGGIVGINNYNVSASQSSISIADLEISNQSIYQIGGIAGIANSTSTIKNTNVSGSGIVISKNNSTLIIGGLVATNEGVILNCSNNMQTIQDSNYKNSSLGGLVAYNLKSANVRYCQTSSNIYGQYVGGLVYRNEGSIYYSRVYKENSKALLKGYYVAGLVNYMDKGEIVDCSIDTVTIGIDENSISAGMVINFTGTKDSYGTIKRCVINNYFKYKTSANGNTISGNGLKYNVSVDNVFEGVKTGLFKKARNTGTIINCVILKNTEDGIQKDYKIKKDSVSDSNYKLATSAEMQLKDTYSNGTKNSFDFNIGSSKSNVWYYTGVGLPVLSVFVK